MSVAKRPIRITKAMVRRFCRADAVANHGSPCNCRGEYHAAIRRGLEAALSGKGKQCSPWMCPCPTPTPDPTYHKLCENIVDGEKCYGFIEGVSEYVSEYV